MKIIGIGGEPATGKSTLVFNTLKEFGWPKSFKTNKNGLFQWQQCDDHNLIVLGLYGKGKFSGTDRLVMSVQPEATGIIGCWAGDPKVKDKTILFEGDRLFNKSFCSQLQQDKRLSCHWIVLEADTQIKEQRHKNRVDTQTAVWLKGRVTKVANLVRELQDVKIWQHNTEQDTYKVVKELVKMIKE